MRLPVLALLAALATTGSQAFEQKTTWFTIRVMPPDESSPHLFLTQTSNGLRLERYRSGDPAQMWAPVQQDYPTAAPVTGGSPISDLFAECFGSAGYGCGSDGRSAAYLRLVSRSSGRCVAIGASRATTTECSNTDQNQKSWQELLILFPLDQTAFVAARFITRNKNCLAANTSDGYHEGMPVCWRSNAKAMTTGR
jgi:hypothetical protein